VIAAAVLRLAEDGVLDLDAVDPDAGYSLRQLLQHTAGLPDYGGLADYHAAVAAGDEPWSAGDLRDRIGDRRPFRPGEGWAYSNIGYLILRERLEAVTGLRLGEALSRLVLTPLGVSATLAETPDDLDGVTGVQPGYHPDWVYHGLLVGTLADAARLLDGVLAGRLFPVARVAEMARSHPVGSAIPGRPWTALGYGLGVMTPDVGARRVVGHTGGGPNSAIAVYAFEGRIGAAFTTGDDAGAVERAAVGV